MLLLKIFGVYVRGGKAVGKNWKKPRYYFQKLDSSVDYIITTL